MNTQNIRHMKKIIEKLIEVQAELKAPKGQTNKFGNYKYRSCEDILESVKPLLKKHSLFLYISDEIQEVAGRFYVNSLVSITDGVDTLSVNGVAREEESKKGMDGSQISGASSSYARKYALNGLFAIDDTKDSDATNLGNSDIPRLDNVELAIYSIQLAKTKDDLINIWNKYPDYQSDSKFLEAVKNKKGKEQW